MVSESFRRVSSADGCDKNTARGEEELSQVVSPIVSCSEEASRIFCKETIIQRQSTTVSLRGKKEISGRSSWTLSSTPNRGNHLNILSGWSQRRQFFHHALTGSPDHDSGDQFLRLTTLHFAMQERSVVDPLRDTGWNPCLPAAKIPAL